MNNKVFWLLLFLLPLGGCELRAEESIKSVPETAAVTGEVEAKSIDAVLEEALTSMNMPLNDVSAVLVDLQGEDYAAFQADELRYPASLIKLTWSIEALRRHGPEADLIKLIRQAIAPGEDYWGENTAANQILTEYLANSEIEDCDLRAENIGEIAELFPEGGSYIRRLHPYMDDGVLVREPMGCDVDYQRNQMTADTVGWIMKELAVGGDQLGLTRDVIDNVFQSSLKRNQFEENSAEWSVTRTFLGEWLPEDITLFSKVGYTESDGRMEGAIIAFHPDGKFERSWAIAIFVPPGYEQALPQFSATVYQQLTGEQR